MDPRMNPQYPQPTYSPGVAAVLSFFIPGLGQIYKGQIFNGLFWLVLMTIAYGLAVATVGLGLVIALPLHLLCIIGASRPSR